MSFPRYPNYKPSGVEWLGEVPEHWELRRFQRCVNISEGQVDPEDSTYSDALLIAPNHIESGTGRLLSCETANEQGAESGKYYCRSGDVIYSKIRPVLRKVCIAPENCLCSADMYPLSGHSGLNNQYLYWMILSEQFSELAIRESQRVAMPKINRESLKEISITLPPSFEQGAITQFLYRETAKIDALVAEQQRLIELLKEKRQAVISHAVTKGLDPTVPMKPSGIEWLGDIPAHWKATALKRLARPGKKTFVDGDWIESPFICNDGIRLIQTGNIGIGYYKEQGYRYISESTFEELQCTEIFPRDVLICRLDGPVGRACLAPDLGVRMITSVDNAILKPSDDIFPEFVVSLLSSVPWIAWMDALCRVGGGFRLRVSRSQLGEILLPIPPFDEQVLIAQHLSTLATEWDVLTTEAERAIELLQERRTALISAAVTGQIDVRQLAQGVAA